jgi:hypothetical protein
MVITGHRVEDTPDDIINAQDALDEISPALPKTDDAAIEAPYIGLSDDEVIERRKIRAALLSWRY